MSKWIYSWIHLIDSKDDYERLWDYIFKSDDLLLGSYIVIDGSLTFKNGNKIGKNGEILAGITTLTNEKNPIKKMIEERVSDSSKTILISDLATEEMKITPDGGNLIKKAKMFKKPSEFKNYLRKIGFEI